MSGFVIPTPDPVEEEGGGGGVTDHGALTGLADNDHPQYALASALVTDHGALTGLSDNDHPQYALASAVASRWSLVDEDTVLVTSGDITLNQTAVTDLTAFDMTFQGAQAGDVVKVHCDFALGSTAQFVGFDWYTMVGGNPINPFGPGLSASLVTTSGLRGWFVPAQAFAFPLSSSARRTLVSGDISGGNVTVRLRYAKTTTTGRSLLASTNDQARVWGELWRPPS